MEQKTLPAFLQSSQDPTEISNRIKGIVLGFSSLIILLVGQFFHIALSANDMISLATEIGTVSGAIWTLWGVGLWLLSLFKK